MEQLALNKKITIIIAVMSAMFFASLNMTIMGTSLPKIVAEIGGMEYFNWVFSIYMLTSSVTASLVGKLSDIYGRKIFILTGICIFMIGSLLSGFSQSISQLILFRGIQGAGGGMIMSSAVTTVGDLFSPRERGRWQGVMAGVMGVSSLIGPTVGGYIVDHMNWSWVFWIFLPIGLFAFMMILKLYPTVQRREKEQIDYLGSFLLTLTILTFLLGFVKHKYLGVATATSQLFRQMGATVGVSIMGLIMATKMSQKLAETSLPGSMAREDLLNPQLLMRPHAAEEMKQKVSPELYPHVEQLLETSKEALNYALSEVFWFGTGMVVLAFILTLFLKEIPLRTSNEEDSQSAVDRIKRTMQG